ncbi:UNVERIFIED_CONTAM: hypothetical protein FKN15_046069 [Acipenser sinensis]
MFAARSVSAGRGPDELARSRKHSVVSVTNKSLKSAHETRNNGTAQVQQRVRRHALIRELEMSWYLKIFDLSHEETTAFQTGMLYRCKSLCKYPYVRLYVWNTTEIIQKGVFKDNFTLN